MENELENSTTSQLKKNHQLLLENNFLLRKIIEQNHLTGELLRKNIRWYSQFWLWWSESDEVIQLRKKLKALLKEVDEYKNQ